MLVDGERWEGGLLCMEPDRRLRWLDAVCILRREGAEPAREPEGEALREEWASAGGGVLPPPIESAREG